MNENDEQQNNLEQDNKNINDYEITERIEKENLKNVSDTENSNTPIDKDLQKIKKITMVVMGIFVVITISIFLWNIFNELLKAIKSEEVEYVRSEENYKITEIFEQENN